MTLIETALALLIAALVSAYAVPTYREYRARGHRQAAVQALYACALQLEAGEESAHGPAAGQPDIGLDDVCVMGTPEYEIAIRGGEDAARGRSADLIEAIPRPGRAQQADRCGVFMLDAAAGRQNRHVGRAGSPDFAGCWSGARR